MLPHSVLSCTQCSSAKAPVHTCFPIYSSPGFATRATCKLVELTSWQAETKGHSASHGTMHSTNQSGTPPVFLQTFLAQPKPVSEAPLHGCFQSRPARVHFPSHPNNWGQTLLKNYPANCSLPKLSTHISPLLASSTMSAYSLACRPPEVPQLEATRAQHLCDHSSTSLLNMLGG